MNNWILFPLVGIPIGFAAFGTYKSYYYAKDLFKSYVMEKVMEELNRRMQNEEDEESFKPIHQNSAILKINHGGKTHSVYVPYNRKKSTAMLREKVYLITGNEKTEILQKPGVPYMVCAKDLGGEFIQVEDLEGNIVKKYESDEIPCF